MAVKNLLVALDGSPASRTALAASIAMQRAHGAHLTGFVALTASMRLAEGENTWLPKAIAATLQKSTAEATEASEALFREATADLDRDRVHLVESPTSGDISVAEASRFFDVTLVGIPAPGARATDLHPDRIALLSGRPVIAFPRETDTSRVARRAMVAWDGSRAAARALSSAVRVLDGKDEITVVTIGAPPAAQNVTSGLDPATALQRQDLPARWIHIPRGKGGIAATLLGQARNLGAGLIVMGAYEHSKFREDIFGGVTHDVMAATDIPVYLAH